MKRVQFILGVAMLVMSAQAKAHGGGLDAEGCHTNRKTGDYHCHGGGAAPRAPAERSTTSAPPPSRFVRDEPLAAPSRGTGPTCYVGPRGGTYTITKSGKKNYSGC